MGNVRTMYLRNAAVFITLWTIHMEKQDLAKIGEVLELHWGNPLGKTRGCC